MTLNGDSVPPIRDVQVTRTTRSGRVGELRIRPAPDRLLYSAAFRAFVTQNGDVVGRLVVDGHGAGHGVGMCQWGAIGRARAGQGYVKILTTYFPGTAVARLY